MVTARHPSVQAEAVEQSRRQGYTSAPHRHRGVSRSTMSKWFAIILNLVAPGAGLIVLRREWLGTLLAAFFTALSLVGLWGWLIIPLVIPTWLVGGSLVGAGLLWTWSQWLLYHRMKETCTPEVNIATYALLARKMPDSLPFFRQKLGYWQEFKIHRDYRKALPELARSGRHFLLFFELCDSLRTWGLPISGGDGPTDFTVCRLEPASLENI